MKLYLAGAEVPSHRNLLIAAGAPHVALSFVGLRRRVKLVRPWNLREKFPQATSIFLDSGAFTVNSKDPEDDDYGPAYIDEMYRSYQAFVQQNAEAAEFISEFDALRKGQGWIENERRTWWADNVPAEKFMPIWHPEWGLANLQKMAETYQRIGVPATALGGRNLVPLLNSLVHEHGVKLHGVAMTKVDEMSTVEWHSVASTSWVSPQRFGDTIVWTGNELKRYPKAYKEQARKRHRTLFEREGFDAAKIEDGDASEVLRLSIWSWRQLEDNINRHQQQPAFSDAVTAPPKPATDADTGSAPEVVVTGGSEMAHDATTDPGVIVIRETVPLPVMGMSMHSSPNVAADGTEEVSEVPVIGVRSKSTRVCNSCFLANKCPAFEPGSNCKFDIPVEIKTRDQFKALQDSLLTMQAQRVLFMRFAEEAEGGYADPNLSSEIDRLSKMIKQKHEIEEGVFSMRMEVKGSGGGPGMLARMFGDEASQRARALAEPVPADRIIEDYMDAEVVGS
jgi:hypothetical protein